MNDFFIFIMKYHKFGLFNVQGKSVCTQPCINLIQLIIYNGQIVSTNTNIRVYQTSVISIFDKIKIFSGILYIININRK